MKKKEVIPLIFPIFFNWIIGWSIWIILSFKIKNYSELFLEFQKYVSIYPTIFLILVSPFYYKKYIQKIREKQAVINIKKISLNFIFDILWVTFLSFFIAFLFFRNTDLSSLKSISILEKTLHAVSMLIVSPVVEEIIFRIGVYNFSHKFKLGFKKGILISGVLFSLWHANPYLIIPAFFIGMLWYWMYYKYLNIYVPIIIHFFSNFILFVYLYF